MRILALCSIMLLALVEGVAPVAAETLPAISASNAPVRGNPYVRLPAGAYNGQPLQVMVAIHGMGGNGPDFAADFTQQADRYGWLIVAPTFDFGDWHDPATVAREDGSISKWLLSYLDQLPAKTGLPIRPQVLLLGHSRGAQFAHRFAEFHPDRVLAVAALSAGTYTLPMPKSATGTILAFPFGINDVTLYDGGVPFDQKGFNKVQFMVGVGSDDNSPTDLPRQWDPFLGTTRLQRAQAFAAAMQKLGATSILRVFQGAQHGLTPEMRSSACAFLGRASTAMYTSPRVALNAPIPLAS